VDAVRGQITTAPERQLESEDKGSIAQEGVSDAKNRLFSPPRLHYITMQIPTRLQGARYHPSARMQPSPCPALTVARPSTFRGPVYLARLQTPPGDL